ncbi:MAG: 4Fe-4S binding protein [Brevefilum sp.]|nr:4Fe-4S binding protein [Brevefilum sp.]MDT8381617.1 4Fe-4S binding protein [Brevefilum sp.]MDW7753851.1 4Fe-4S binding protein [Brevefilum sp.]
MSKLSYRMIYIAGAPAGLLGVDELFNALFDTGLTPNDENLREKIIKGVKKHNFVPKPAIKDYQDVLLREYLKYYQACTGGDAPVTRDYGLWEGHPREHIPWFPTVSEELCNGCGKCIEVCPKDVFQQLENGKVMVVEPFLCIVGCCFCKSACDPKAILMPQREMLDQYRHGQKRAT